MFEMLQKVQVMVELKRQQVIKLGNVLRMM